MKEICANIQSEKEARRLIETSEEVFTEILRRDVAALVGDHVAGGAVRMLTLSGPTCSGKTTTANHLIRQIENVGYHAVVLSIDDFFLDRGRSNSVEGERPDYDSVKAIDLPAFSQCMESLRAGRVTRLPHYSFRTGKRDYYTEYSPTKQDIYVIEGIQAVYPEVVRILDADYKSIFIHVAEDVRCGDVMLTRYEIRLLRRIVRDYQFRSAHPEFTLFMWESVRQNEERSIYPNAGRCDVTIDSFLPYELFFLAADALPLLAEVPETSAYYKEARRLMALLEPFLCPYFQKSMVPADSVFREFIGP